MATTTPNATGFGLQAVASALIPQGAMDLIAIASRGGVKPAKRQAPKAHGSMLTTEYGAAAYTVGALSVVCIDGVMSMGENPLSWLFGGCSSESLASDIREAADDGATRAVVLRVNSPGGDVAGVADLVEAVRYAKSKKPVHMIAADAACSAAFWVSALANEIVTLPTGLVGSIGVFAGPFIDSTKALEEDGVAVFNARTGENKGAGGFGVPVSDAIKAEQQRIVETCAVSFYAAVSEGRGLSEEQIKALQGSVFAGPDAVAAGLADRVVPSVDAYIAELLNKYAGRAAAPGASASALSPKSAALGVSNMAMDWSTVTDDDLKNAPDAVVSKIKGMNPDKEPEPVAPAAATSAQLKAAGFSDEFRLKALDANWTMEQARDQWSSHLAARVANLETEKAALAAKLDSKAATATKVAAVTNTGGAAPVAAANGTDSGITEYEQLVRAEMAKNGNHRFKAVHAVNMARPDLYRQWHAEQIASASKK